MRCKLYNHMYSDKVLISWLISKKLNDAIVCVICEVIVCLLWNYSQTTKYNISHHI